MMRARMSLGLALLCLLVAGRAAAQPAPAPNPADVVLAWLAGHERRDLEAGLALMADDAVYEGYACSPCVGKAAIGPALRSHTTDTDARISLVPGTIQVRPTHVTLEIESSAAQDRAAGRLPTRFQRSFVVEGGLIVAACSGDSPCYIGPRAALRPAAPAPVAALPPGQPLPATEREREPATGPSAITEGRVALALALALALGVTLLVAGTALDLLRRRRGRRAAR